MAGRSLELRRTGGDLGIGVLLVLASLYIFGNVVFATRISVLVLGWTALVGGVAMVLGTVVRPRSETSWSFAVGGVVLAVLGLSLLRNTVAGALTLTLMAGAMLLATGVARVLGAVSVPEARGVLLVSGLVSAALGLFVLLNLATATFTLLGVLLGTQTLVDGLTLVAVGRLRPSARPAAAAAEGTVAGHPTRV